MALPNPEEVIRDVITFWGRRAARTALFHDESGRRLSWRQAQKPKARDYHPEHLRTRPPS